MSADRFVVESTLQFAVMFRDNLMTTGQAKTCLLYTSIKQLKSEQLNQLEQYMDVILKQDCFNDANEFWTFILIGQDYDDICLLYTSNWTP